MGYNLTMLDTGLDKMTSWEWVLKLNGIGQFIMEIVKISVTLIEFHKHLNPNEKRT